MENPPLRVPHHLAIIPDGNRRYARAHGMSTAEGYLIGLDLVVDTVRWLLSQGVRHVSAYAASQENIIRRPKPELAAVFTSLGRFFTELEKVPGVGLHVFGDVESVPDWAPNRERFLALREANPDDAITVHFGLNYSGTGELSWLMKQVEKYGSEAVSHDPSSYMLSAGVPPVDLVYRSGGQHRLSGFLPFQTAYSELYFTEKFWPEVTQADIQVAFDWYAAQPRNFGA